MNEHTEFPELGCYLLPGHTRTRAEFQPVLEAYRALRAANNAPAA